MSIFKHFKLHYWPGLTFGLFIFNFLVSYLISVLGGHTYGFFPYISDTGTIVPESCIFGQLLNFAALSLGITHYIRYRQVEIAIVNGDITDSTLRKWNRLALWAAIPFSVGISVVANFQETSVLVVHMLGAVSAFGMGCVYYIIQTKISRASVYLSDNQDRDFTISKTVYNLRLILSALMFPLFATVGISGTIALVQFKGKSMPWWTEKEGGYVAHLVSSFSEWILAISMFIYLLTFTDEFKTISFTDISFVSKKVNEKLSESENS